MYKFLFLFSTAANEGQRRPTKMKKGPNDTRHVIWAIGVCFLLFFSVLLTTHHVSRLHHTHHTHYYKLTITGDLSCDLITGPFLFLLSLLILLSFLSLLSLIF